MKKIIIIISIVVSIFLITAEYYARSDHFSLRIRPVVVDLLTSVLGSDVRIGSVRANFIPMYIEARDISLADETGGEFAAIRKIKVYLNPVPLLLKKIRLSSILFLEPRIFIERTESGVFNYQAILDRIKNNTGGTRSENPYGFTILLGTITVNHGRISFNDGPTATGVSLAEIQLSAKVGRKGDNVRIAVKNCEIRTSAPAYKELSGTLKASVRYDDGRLRIESVNLTTADATMSLRGDIGRLPDIPLDLRVTMRSGIQTLGKFTTLFKSEKKKETGLQAQAEATIRGNIKSPKLEGTLKLNGIAYRGMLLSDANVLFSFSNNSFKLTGKKWKLSKGAKDISMDAFDAVFDYQDGAVDIRHFDILAGDLRVGISGRADIQRGLDALLDAHSEQGQALSFLTSFPLQGKAAVRGSLTGAFMQPVFEGEMSAGPATIRGIVFNKAVGGIRFRDKKITLISVDIHQQDSRYVFDGSADLSGIETFYSARLKVVRSDVVSVVALFYEPLPLRLSARGELSFNGTAKDFTGYGRLDLESGSAYNESFTRGTVTAYLTRDKIEFPEVHVIKGTGTVKGTGWIGFNGSYNARIQGNGVKLSEIDYLPELPFEGPCFLEIESSGTFSQPRLTAALRMEELFYNQKNIGSLAAGLEIADRTLTIQSALDGERAAATASIALTRPFGWTLQATVKADDLDPFLITGEKEILGRARLTADGTINARGNGMDTSTFAGAALFRHVAVLLGDYHLENGGEITASMQAGRISITSLDMKGPGTVIRVAGGAGLLKDIDLLFTGSLNLSLLRLLSDEIEHAGGTAEVKLAVRDEWKAPEVTGEMVVRNGDIKVKNLSQKVSGVKAKLTFDRSRMVVDSLSGEFGGGGVSATGWAQLDGSGLQNFSTTASIDNVTLRYPEGLTATVSGNMYYDGDATEQSLTGDLTVKRARYDKRVEWKSMLVDVGRGLYQKKKVDTGRIGDTHINIRFHGKEGILFQNNLAKMPLAVDVFLQGTIDQPQLLGRIEAAKGSVYFRKNEFRILHASVDFVDPNRINPVLDIRAEIRVRDLDREYRIRLAVSGNADRAVVTLVSDPSLHDSDILALLALGKTADKLKGREAGVGMNEAAYFATGQFQDIFESRARSLTGLDRFQVDPYITKGDTSVPRVTVGKEIMQDKLFVTYSSNVGSTTPEQVFRIEYILNKFFSVVGERNELGNTGADIKYRFEFK